jgi:hypothetical protein
MSIFEEDDDLEPSGDEADFSALDDDEVLSLSDDEDDFSDDD